MPTQPAWETEPATRFLLKNNPLHGNPLATRADLQKAVADLVTPVLPYFSQGNARIRLGVGATHYDSVAAEMESFVRPLWGLAPLLSGGGTFAGAERWVEGLANGTDPTHEDYWGDVGPVDQRMVEMAGIANAMLLTPQTFWAPLAPDAKVRAASWLRTINDYPTADCNWLFFRVLVNLALRHVGEDWSEQITRQALDRLDSFHIADGYYRDGTWNQLDYYTPMALHFYGLMVARLAGDVFPEHATRYRDRATAYAQGFQHWFADDGAAIPFGRSMTYRFVQGAFWAGCAWADHEVLPWGRIKGLLLRHLRWWADRPIADRDGILSIGYAYPNLLASEAYNAPGSPYWALKSFMVLDLPETHPFWTADEEPADAMRCDRKVLGAGGFIVRQSAGDAVMLTGGQDGRQHRCNDAKYGRFAYSSAFAFSVASDAGHIDSAEACAVDSGLMVSRDGQRWLSRRQITESGIDRDMAWGIWQPDDDLTIESWIDFGPDGWHVRLHRIATKTPLHLAEGGFALDRTGERTADQTKWYRHGPHTATAHTRSGISHIEDLAGQRMSSQRTGGIVRAAPNTNLRSPRTVFPRLTGQLEAGTHWLATAVFATPNAGANIPALVLPTSIRAFCEAENLEIGGI